MEEDKILERAKKYAMVGALSGIGLGVGIVLLIDDADDFGLFATEWHPSPIHHWWIGILLIIAGLIGILIYLLLVFGVIG